MKRIFISHAPEDADYRDSLATHLDVLCTAGVIASWHSGMVTPGEDWREAVDREIGKADIVVFLVSASFLASKSCQSAELGPALGRWRQRRVILLPVIVRACDWAASPIARLKVFPAGGKPVATWPHQDDAWAEVTRTIRVTTAFSNIGRALGGKTSHQTSDRAGTQNPATPFPEISAAPTSAMQRHASPSPLRRSFDGSTFILIGVRGGFSSSGYTELTGQRSLREALDRVKCSDEGVYSSLGSLYHGVCGDSSMVALIVFLNLSLPGSDMPFEIELIRRHFPSSVFVLYGSGAEFQRCMAEIPSPWAERFQHYYLLRKSEDGVSDAELRQVLDDARQLALRRAQSSFQSPEDHEA
ncbi:toll/interleukin-1 receptor domain-containing protein [Sorangium sp. So ce542]|uniref:toll/interleukin-1 receptor domain-containing protein n=1 Tax=Sorangium sp. So ce542 TaxID=3133316 RepID=UPI003F5DB5B0